MHLRQDHGCINAICGEQNPGRDNIFYEDFGTDKEFVEEKILELGVTCYSTQHHESKPSKAGERRFFLEILGQIRNSNVGRLKDFVS